MHETVSLTGAHDQLDAAEYKLYQHAEQTLDDAAVRSRYETFHWYYVGSKESARRLDGEHPWPERTTPHVFRVYAVPVFSGFDAGSGRLLHVSHDDWVHPDDPTSWFVAEGSLHEDRVTEYSVHSSHVDQSNRTVLGLLGPYDRGNWPQGLHPQLHAPRYDQTRLEFRVDQNYVADRADYREGRYGRRTAYEELDVLNSMRRVVLEKRFAEMQDELERQLAAERNQFVGQRGVRLAVGAYAA